MKFAFATAFFAAVFGVLSFAAPAKAANQIATSVSQNYTPITFSSGVCAHDYTIMSDGDYSSSIAFCPQAPQPSYAITFNFDRPQNEYATRLVIWANAGNFVYDNELRIFNLNVTYVDPLTLQELTYSRKNVNLADTVNIADPVYADFTDSSGNPMPLYGVKRVVMSDLRYLTTSDPTNVPMREIQLDTAVDPSRAANVVMSKTSTLSAANTLPQFVIPGNDMYYAITVENRGNLALDMDSLSVFDILPENLTFFNGDADGPGPGSANVIFEDSGSGLIFSPSAVAFASSTPASFADCNHTPEPNYDANVHFVCVKPSGAFASSTSAPYPSFTLYFRAKVD